MKERANSFVTTERISSCSNFQRQHLQELRSIEWMGGTHRKTRIHRSRGRVHPRRLPTIIKYEL